ncbi:lysine-specific demethylase JMJ25-like protein [Tanacetum coccineum]|uniref:Lysine-specific demethylase JMJ25-like protein n=1 Tax=Tanacetum coccineum TaxID=301880 RepID=A0ABQ4ZW83_9ASTR
MSKICNRNDGRKWRCGRPAFEGRTLCEKHYLQGKLRQNKEPVPDDLKFERQPHRNNHQENDEIRSNASKKGKRKVLDDSEDDPVEITQKGPRKKSKKSKKSKSSSKSSADMSEDLDDALKKMNLKKGDLQLDLIRGYLNSQVEKKKGKQPQKEDIVKELKYGRLEISQTSPSTPPIPVTNVKVGAPAPISAPTRFFRSKNIDRVPVATMQVVFRNLISTILITVTNQDKEDVQKECPVCCGTCSCKVCMKGKPKEDRTKDLVVYRGEEKFEKTEQLLYMIHLLLPILEQINHEKDTEMDIESNIQEKDQSELQIQDATDSTKPRCCGFCKASIVDVHRSCGNCSYILCLPCCREFREGHLHGGLRDLKNTTTSRRKSLCTVLCNWKTNEDGSIGCPPKNLGGCGDGILGLFSQLPMNWTKDLEENAKELVYSSSFTKFSDFDSSYCAICDGNDKNEGENEDLYFSIKQDLGDKNLEHFTKHWVKGQPLIIRDAIKSESELNWDPIFIIGQYLERSTKSRKEKAGKVKTCSDWFEVERGRQQIFTGGKTDANACHEKLKLKVWLSSGIFRENFPSYYDAVMHALPLEQYTNPLTGILNLAAYLTPESQNVDLGPFVHISYGRPEDLTEGDFLTRLCYHAYDMVNILVHTTEHPLSEKKLNKVKILLDKYSSQDEESSRKTKINEACGKSSFSSEVTQQSELEDNTNNEELTQIPNGEVEPSVLSDDSTSIVDSDDEDLCEDESSSRVKVVDTCGAQWDVFRREDVPKLLEFLRKYSNELISSYYPKKVVHPILDDSFYLDAFHKKYLKEEYDVEPWTFNQHVGEAVIIPAGCPYQVKKIKSCVNVVLESISPESASMGVKLSDEIRQLPVNHKAKGKMIDVKTMSIHSMNAAVEEINKAPQTEAE